MIAKYFEINQNGHNVRCKLYCGDLKRIARVVVFGHGFGGHKDNGAAEKFAERLTSKHKDTAMVTFNWPSHGDDVKKRICLADCDTYLRMVLEYVFEELSATEVYGYATSFGGYLFLKYIAEHGNPFRKAALRCPAVNMYEVLTSAIMTEENFAQLRKGEDAAVGFDRKIMVGQAFLDELQANDVQKSDDLAYADALLILHGTEDEIVPFDAGKRFAENHVVEFVPVTGADHRFQDPKHMDTAIQTILDFYEL